MRNIAMKTSPISDKGKEQVATAATLCTCTREWLGLNVGCTGLFVVLLCNVWQISGRYFDRVMSGSFQIFPYFLFPSHPDVWRDMCHESGYTYIYFTGERGLQGGGWQVKNRHSPQLEKYRCYCGWVSYGLENRGIVVRLRTGARDLSLSAICPDLPWGPLSLRFNGYWEIPARG
jgi:hypothetical protein